MKPCIIIISKTFSSAWWNSPNLSLYNYVTRLLKNSQ